jgi:hypothetical protein
MAVNLSFIGGAGWQFFDNNGNVLSGGLLYTYEAGTTTPQTTFTSRSGTIANTNPIILDSAGRTPEQIWSTEGLLYKYVIADSSNIVLRTWDNIGGSVVASDLAQDLANSSSPIEGDALVGFRQSNSSGNLTGSVGGTVHTKLQENVSVNDFGAVGDGVADDTAALTAAIAHGGVISATNLTLRVTLPITATITSNLIFNFKNTTIIYDGAAAAPYVLQFNVQGCTLSGQIEIDCDLKSHKGLYITNTTDIPSNVQLTPIVRNCYKTLTSITGDGLFLDGLFNTVRLQDPVFENMVMASGAGVSGVSGIRGATIKARSGTQYPKMVEIINPRVVDVYSENTAYVADQDGIAVFSPEDVSAAPAYAPFEQKAFISGGLMKNCMGRAFKFQNQYAEVTGTHFERDRVLTVAPTGVEVDFQTGGGELSNVTARYINGSIPLIFCNLSLPQTADFVVPYGSAKGIKIFTDAVAPNCMRAVVQLAGRTITEGNRLFVSDISVIGNVSGVLGLNPLSGSAAFFVSATGLRAAPLEGLVYAYGSFAAGGTVTLSDCFNLGSSTIPSYRRTSSTADYFISGVNVIGFSDYKVVDEDTGDQGQSLRLHSLTAPNQIKSGMLRPVAFTIADGASFALPPTALNGQTNMILATVGGTRNAQAIFSCDTSQVIALVAGSDWVVGTTTEPATGSYRIWSGTSGQTISNRSGITRTFTVLMFG